MARILAVATAASFALEAAAMVDGMALGAPGPDRLAWAGALVLAGLGAGALARARRGAGVHRAIHLILMGGLLAVMGTATASHASTGMRMSGSGDPLELALILCCGGALAASVVALARARGRGHRALRVEHSASAAAMAAMLAMVLL